MKIKKFIKNNISFIIAFIVGIIISGSSVYAATAAASDVSYSPPSGSGLSSNVQSAISELYQKANTAVPIDPDTFKTNRTKTVYASSKGVCIKRNGKLNCFKINNWAEEQTHIKKVFSDISCYVDSEFVGCSASDVGCSVDSSGGVSCRDSSGYSDCNVYTDGSVDCN